jgi:hypothetical protein
LDEGLPRRDMDGSVLRNFDLRSARRRLERERLGDVAAVLRHIVWGESVRGRKVVVERWWWKGGGGSGGSAGLYSNAFAYGDCVVIAL